MDNIDDQFWRPFAQLAEQYPDDHGLRMTSDLARRFGEEWQRVLGRSPTAGEVATAPLPTAVGCAALALHTPQLDNPGPPENVAKPWKKPWDA
jgi:hypothetical protein